MPKISVIIPLYNHEVFITETINSVLNQSFSDFELIVIDDGSQDKSLNIVKAIKDSRLKIISQENQGAHSTINRGIKMASCKYIAILNSDDLWYPLRLEKCINELDSDPAIKAVFSYIECVDMYGEFVREQQQLMDNDYYVDRPKNFDSLTINEKLIGGNFLYTTSNLVCHKKVFSALGGFNDLRYIHDYDFFLRLTSQCKVSLLKEPLLKYRIHANNTISEDFSQSIFETGLVLSSFFLKQQQKTLNTQQQCNLMEQFYRTLNAYSSERVMLTLLVFGKDTDLFSLMKSPQSLSFRKTVLAGIVDNEQLRRKASWQKEQTDLWWQQAQEFKAEAKWRKQQADKWWSEKQALDAQRKKWKFALLSSLFLLITLSVSWLIF